MGESLTLPGPLAAYCRLIFCIYTCSCGRVATDNRLI
jgi:hypothetical protein